MCHKNSDLLKFGTTRPYPPTFESIVQRNFSFSFVGDFYISLHGQSRLNKGGIPGQLLCMFIHQAVVRDRHNGDTVI